MTCRPAVESTSTSAPSGVQATAEEHDWSCANVYLPVAVMAARLGRAHAGQTDAAHLLVRLGVDHPHHRLVLVGDVDEPTVGGHGDTPEVAADARPKGQRVGLGVDEGQGAEGLRVPWPSDSPT